MTSTSLVYSLHSHCLNIIILCDKSLFDLDFLLSRLSFVIAIMERQHSLFSSQHPSPYMVSQDSGNNQTPSTSAMLSTNSPAPQNTDQATPANHFGSDRLGSRPFGRSVFSTQSSGSISSAGEQQQNLPAFSRPGISGSSAFYGAEDTRFVVGTDGVAFCMPFPTEQRRPHVRRYGEAEKLVENTDPIPGFGNCPGEHTHLSYEEWRLEQMPG